MINDFQTVLLKLYTDQKLRAEFLNNTGVFLKQFRLSEREREALKGLAGHEFVEFSGGLSGKRKRTAERVLENQHATVVVSNFYRSSPAIFFKKGCPTPPWVSDTQVAEIAEGMYAILKELKGKISAMNIFAAFLKTDNAGIKDLYRLLKFINQERLEGRKTFIL